VCYHKHMGQALIRNLDDNLLDAYRAAARRNRRSLEAELRDALGRARPVDPRQAEQLLALSRRLRAMTANPAGSVEGWQLIRDDRDNR
jgi:antitoxin FitA